MVGGWVRSREYIFGLLSEAIHCCKLKITTKQINRKLLSDRNLKIYSHNLITLPAIPLIAFYYFDTPKCNKYIYIFQKSLCLKY